MSTSQNRAAYLVKVGAPLEVGDVPMPAPGPGEIVVKSAAVALNPLDCKQQEVGLLIQNYPATIGCDVAGEVYEVGPDVTRFKTGDRIIGHTMSITGPQLHGSSFQHYTIVAVDKAAILPDNISFTDGVVLPIALETAFCGLSNTKITETMPGIMPGVMKPTLGLPLPSAKHVPASGKVLVVSGGSSSVGSIAIQLATASGIHIISIASSKNFKLSKRCGAKQVFDYNDEHVVTRVVDAVRSTGLELIGIFDAISDSSTYEINLAILESLGGGHLACTHPPPANVPETVKAGMIYAVDDIAKPVWNDFVGQALLEGTLQCLPIPTVVGKGLEFIEVGLKVLRARVSATKLVIEL